MSTRYSRAHKNLVLRIYGEVFKCDVVKTAQYTQIPERTIRDWIYAARRAAAASRTSAKMTFPKMQRRI